MLNEKQRLPKFLVIVLDKDLIACTKAFGSGATYIIGSSLHYIIKQVDQLIDRCKLDLFDKKPGALFEEYPQVVWVRIMKRPAGIDRREFTKILAL